MNDIKFNLSESLQRLDTISSSRIYVPDNEMVFPPLNELPSASLTKVFATVVCIRCDIENSASTELRAQYHRAIISEFSCILGQESQSRDIFVRDNLIFAVFETPLKSHVKSVINATARINALKSVINAKLGGGKKYLTTLVSVSFDNLEMQLIPCPRQDVKVQNIVWTGKAINNVVNMSNNCKDTTGVLIESVVYNNLDDEDRAFFFFEGTYYKSNFVNTLINNWVKNNV